MSALAVQDFQYSPRFARGAASKPEGVSVGTLLKAIVNPAFVVDVDDRLIAANEAAQLLFGPNALFSVASGQVEPVDSTCRSLWRMLKWRSMHGFEASGSMRDGEERNRVTLLSLSAREVLALLPPAESQADGSSVFMQFGRRYGITAAESDVLVRLAAGDAAEDIARFRGRSVATVRTQIRALLMKTNTRSIRSLIALALKLS